jgi:Cu(I)/Ag(I) efflux system periplasmic protein CusF
MKNPVLLVLCAAVLAVGGAWAAGEPARPVATAAANPAAAITAGEVRKVDTAQGKITIRHEAIVNLDMPAMTMVFRASRPELLKDVKAGDKIRFRAESDQANNLIVTRIEPAK